MENLLIALIEPFFGGSHKTWAEGLVKHSTHNFIFYTLKDRNWKWRMYAGAIQLAEKVNKCREAPDLFLVTDMLCLNTFISLLKKELRSIPFVLYFHENQLNYPWSSRDPDKQKNRDRHYAFTNYRSALAADSIAFNSKFHLDQFLTSLADFLHAFPDPNGTKYIEKIRMKSKILYPGIEDYDKVPINGKKDKLILWNHRWEYDKNPKEFFSLIRELKKQKTDFKLAVLGERFENAPAIFEKSEKEFENEIVHWGFIADYRSYKKLLEASSVMPVTSNQDFFGISCVEDMSFGVLPLLPNRMAFPEHIPEEYHKEYLYNDFNELVAKSKILLKSENENRNAVASRWSNKYKWNKLIPDYDQFLFDSFNGQKKF